jgi:hypothetical protein
MQLRRASLTVTTVGQIKQKGWLHNEKKIIWYPTTDYKKTVAALHNEFFTLKFRRQVLPLVAIFGHYRHF